MMNQAILTALLIPFLGTALGSAFVFFMKKDIPALVQKALLGFASGVMVAASVWSLLIPSMEMGAGNVWPAIIGLLQSLWASGDCAAVAEGVLAADFIWGENLNAVPGLREKLTADLELIQAKGMRAAVESIL